MESLPRLLLKHANILQCLALSMDEQYAVWYQHATKVPWPLAQKGFDDQWWQTITPTSSLQTFFTRWRPSGTRSDAIYNIYTQHSILRITWPKTYTVYSVIDVCDPKSTISNTGLVIKKRGKYEGSLHSLLSHLHSSFAFLPSFIASVLDGAQVGPIKTARNAI